MRLGRIFVLAGLAATGVASAATVGYFQTNLTSDIPGLAANLDPLLKNPWGMSFSATSPFWLSDQVSNVATLYSGAGVPNPLVVTTPPVPGPGPTGQVFAGGLGFIITPGVTANFIFSTLAGTIDAWNSGTTAVTKFTAPDGAVYTGLAQAGSLLYAADTFNDKIDVFDTSFQKTTVAGNFVDPNVAAGFTPYDIQNVGGNLYVEYAKRNSPGGFVAVFDANGHLLQHISDPHLNSPWGVTLAPGGFGQFANDLLVGNFGDGMINAFDPVTGAFLGTLSNANGSPIVNSGLWAIHFRSPGSGFDPNTLFFAAGINNEADGLFGSIQVVPEPATLGTFGFVVAGAVLVHMRRRRSRERN
uniref:Uncharacterized protein n=1 Tax=Solibacter usitatus (strain Ellin6076) TaxID=234267 RepID=Q01XA9_SOLUE